MRIGSCLSAIIVAALVSLCVIPRTEAAAPLPEDAAGRETPKQAIANPEVHPAKTLIRDALAAERFKIAWEAYADGNSDIWVMNADGSGKVNLTHSRDANEHYPQVSPDGTKIAFTVDAGEGRDAVRSLWIMDVDGQNRRKIADRAREPFWAPDGKVIAYLPQEYPKFDVIDYYTKGMVYHHLDTGISEPHPNSDKLRHLYHPRFTPDGQWIVATVHGGMGFSHAILGIEAHGDKIVDFKIHGCRPTVSPDGKYLAWGSDDHELDTAPLDTEGGTPHLGASRLRIRDAKNKIYHIAWSPDGRFVAFSRGPDGGGDLSKAGTFQAACEIIGVYAAGWNLFAARADRAGVIDVTKGIDDDNGADVLQLTTDGNSNKEAFWFSAPPTTTATPAKE
jgi:Tol biopolymer transport system component